MASWFPISRRRQAEALTPAPAASDPPADRLFLSLSFLISLCSDRHFVLQHYLALIYSGFNLSVFLLLFAEVLIVVLWGRAAMARARRIRRMTSDRIRMTEASDPTPVPVPVRSLLPALGSLSVSDRDSPG